ncbi:hypothetical protein EV363DRAFT_1458084 [Boletus edulis]|nr:hypothetical protein EV363DRAFT_1458084 [Boletus edulis]
MREITADLSGDNWDFSEIGLDSLGTLPLSDLRSTHAGSDAELLPLPPAPNNPSPVRPRLPAVPPPSPPDERAMATPSQQNTTKSRPPPRPKGNAVVPPKHRPAKDTTTQSAPAGMTDGPSLLGCVGTLSLEKLAAKSRPKPKVRHKAAVLPKHQPVGDIPPPFPPPGTQMTCDASAMVSSVQPQPQNHPHPAPSADMTTFQRTAPTTSVVPVTEQPRVSAPSETCTSKRVPVQSKRNAIADAIGTNQPAFNNTSPKKGKRSGECAEGAKKSDLATKASLKCESFRVVSLEQDYSTLLPRLQTTVEADRRSTQDVSYSTPYPHVYVEPSMSAPPSYVASVEGSQLVPNEHVSEVRKWFGLAQEENKSLNLAYPPTPVVEAAEAGPAHTGQVQEPGSPTPSSLALSDYESLPEAPVAPHTPSVHSESYDPNDYDPPSALLQIQQELAPLFVPERVVDWLIEGLSPKTSTEEGVARSH